MPDLIGNFWFLIAATIIITTVVTSVTQAWQKVRRAEQEALLKREMLQRGSSIEDIERVLRASSKSGEATAAASQEEQALEELAECLGTCAASPQVLEEVLSTVRNGDPANRQATCRAVQAVIRGLTEAGQEVEDARILAVVRGLSRPAGPPPAAAPRDPPFDRKPTKRSG